MRNETLGSHRGLKDAQVVSSFICVWNMWYGAGLGMGEGLNIALLSFRECQSDDREEQRELERNLGNGPEGHHHNPEWLC